MTEYVDADGHAITEGYDWWVSAGKPRDCYLGTIKTLKGFFSGRVETELAFEVGGDVIPRGVQLNEDNTGVKA